VRGCDVAIDQTDTRPVRSRRTAEAIGLGLLVLLVLACAWVWRYEQSGKVSSNSQSFVGVVTTAPSAEGIICVRPDPGEPSLVGDVGVYCGVAYPSRGLTVEGIRTGDKVRVIAFQTFADDGEDVSGALVLPPDIGQPPAA